MQTRRRSIVRAATRGVVLSAAVVGLAQSAFGQSVWSGATDNQWGNPLNWAPTGVPAGTGSAVFPDTAQSTIALGAGAQSITNVTFSGTNTPYTIGTDPADVINFVNTGKLTVASTVTASQTIAAGISLTTGTLTVANSGTATTLSLNGPITGAGSVTYTNVATVPAPAQFFVNISGNNTYSGNTSISSNSGTAIIINSNTAFGTGTLTFNSTSGLTIQPAGVDRLISNPVTLTSGFTVSAASTPVNLTFSGAITSGTTARSLTLNDYGKTIYLGLPGANASTITMPNSATTQTMHIIPGNNAGTATSVVINDVIQDPSPLPAAIANLEIGGGLAGFEGTVLINGANTYKGNTTLTPPTSGSGAMIVGIGVTSSVDGSGNIVSGPFGKGALGTASGSASAPTIFEPVGGDRVIANNFSAISTGSGSGLFFNNPATFGDIAFHNLVFGGNFATGGKTYTCNLDASVAVYFGSGTALTTTWSGGGTFQSGSGHAGNIIIDDKVTSTTAVGIQNLAVMMLRNDTNAQTGNWTVQATGTLRVGASHALGASNVIVNGLLQAVPGMSTAVVLPATYPTINATGKFDLTNDSLVYNYTTDQAANIHTQLKNGYNAGAWNGNGSASITSSTAAADASLSTGLGYGEATDLGYSGNITFKNTAIAGNADVVRYTYYGDSTLDGKVDLGNDFNLFLVGFLGGVTISDTNRWVYGDYNYDGVTDSTDFGMFVNGYVASNAGGSLGELADVIEQSPMLSVSQKASLLAAVPEPTSLGVVAMAAGGLMARRRRRD